MKSVASQEKAVLKLMKGTCLNMQDLQENPSSTYRILKTIHLQDHHHFLQFQSYLPMIAFQVKSCMSHSHSISPVAKRKKNLHHPGTTTDKFVIRTSRLQKEVIDEKFAWFAYAINSPFHIIENPHCINMVQSLRPRYSPLNRTNVTGKLLGKVYEREIEQCARGLEGEIVNLSLDGWSKLSHKTVITTRFSTVSAKMRTAFLRWRTWKSSAHRSRNMALHIRKF
ncbi:uncharacterized protein LOC122465760 [Chelonia mydas]|uniref:uncharacterized protein LOC122465760 n=1 Tax=Chelonia mydas TaxID=8469 RepID=UPI001CA893DD|nr:uncharacterized protein LOC122465760 [Chelonia mydas]